MNRGWDYLDFGSSPYDENCAQTGIDSPGKVKAECRKYLAQIIKRFPIPRDVKARFTMKMNPHDFGSYPDVRVEYDTTDAKSGSFAFFCERNMPATWGDVEVLDFEAAYKLELEEEQKVEDAANAKRT